MSQTQTLPIGFAVSLDRDARHRGTWRAAMRRLVRVVASGPVGDSRLSAHMLNDIGLLPEQSPDAPIWGHGGIMWRP
jgi:hypothetical protein